MRRARSVLAATILLVLAACVPKPPPGPAAITDIELVEPRVALGRAAPGGYATGMLRIRALKDGTVVTIVSPSCGCTTVAVKLPARLDAGEILAVPVSIDLTRVSNLGAPKPGAPSVVERDIGVATERGTGLVAKVAVDVSERVRLEPAQVSVGTIAPGTSGSAELLVNAPEGIPMPVVAAVETGRADLTATVTPAENGATRVRVTWSPAHDGDLDALVPLRIDDPAEPRLSVRVLGRAKDLVTVDPDAIVNLAAPTSRPVVATLTVHRADEQPLEILGATSTSHRVRITIVPGSGPTRSVQVVVPVLPLPGEIVGTLLIRTDAETGGTLEVPIHVRAHD